MDNNELNTELRKFWTPKKCGKHDELAKQHDILLTKFLKASPKDLFEQIAENKFEFVEFSKIYWKDFLKRAKLAEYLAPEYLQYALDVTSSRPAIGKGEFLLASCFSNIGFSSDSGDLIDLTNGNRCELKGLRSTLSGDGHGYRQMNKGIIYTLFAIFDTSTHFDHFNRDCAKEVDRLLRVRPDLTTEALKRLQNLEPLDGKIAEDFKDLYITKPDIFITTGAMQLYRYMKEQNASYLIMTDDEGFCCFKRPETPSQAQKIISNINLSSWQTGDYGMTISIKKDE